MPSYIGVEGQGKVKIMHHNQVFLISTEKGTRLNQFKVQLERSRVDLTFRRLGKISTGADLQVGCSQHLAIVNCAAT